MNKLERLSNNNKENYQLYLKRMTESMNHSTKGLIPVLAQGSKNILDVGCGSGVMLEVLENEVKNAKLTGLDLNIDSINKLRHHTNWKLYHMDFMDMKDVNFDTIIFSSILHEISSYNSDPKKRFTEIPIYDAFKKSYDLLDDNGSIILRDGLLSSEEDRHKKRVISFKKFDDFNWLYRFQNDFRGFDNLDIDTSIKRLDDNRFLVSEGFLKEFLCTYTWGAESYPREINERFGIITKNEWIKLLRSAKFKIETLIESKEEYEKFLSEKVSIQDESGKPYEYPNMSILIKARKQR